MSVYITASHFHMVLSFPRFVPRNRMENASEAAAAVDGTKDGGLELAPEVEQRGGVSLLEGDDEKAYYVSVNAATID